ncbi:MAG: hypothetical protein EBS31_00380 [Burkholderiaceae bacterium]|nr:hypothetical protein [Burkholderiaceae bacterium]
MTRKEIVHIYEDGSKTSEALEPMIENYISLNPDIDYVKLESVSDSSIIKTIIPSRPPIISPFFIGIVDGKINGTASGMISEKDLSDIVD